MSAEPAQNRNLLREQEALRRVATLVAQGTGPERLFDAVADEVSVVLGVGAVSLVGYDSDRQMFSPIADTHGRRSAMPPGAWWPLGVSPLGRLIVETGRSARIDDWSRLEGPVAERHRAEGYGPAVGAPILVDGAIWGYIGVYGEGGEAFPPDCESRLGAFTQLMALAIANVQARDQLRSLAESQGALRRVATLVAQGDEPQTVFTAVAVEAARILGVGAVSLISYDPETELFTKIFGTHGERAAVPDGGSWGLDQCPEGALILRTGGPVRIDDWTRIPGPVAARHREQGFGQCVAAPIVLDGTHWGHIAAFGEAGQNLPPRCEAQLADFTHLMASALSNARTRDELRGLAERQGAALRRVATLVAQQASAPVIFDAVAGEASRALGVARVDVGRCDSGGSVTLLGSTGRSDVQHDHTFSRTGECVAAKVMQSGTAARMDDWATLAAADAKVAAEEGFRSAVGAPITVDGTLWGVIVVLSDEFLHRDTETRLTDFTHLVASSISNVHARNSLIASRARIVTASDETRRRIERNLHDGVQQRLVSVALSVRAARAYPLPREVQSGLDEIAAALDDVMEEIRIFSRGLHPALLSRAGIGPSVRELARRSPVPVMLDVAAVPRLPEPVETAVYYVVSEALANAAKHSRATEVSVTVGCDGPRAGAGVVRATVADDGVGGATPDRGSGLIGLVDRVEALGGRFTLDSPAGRGTTISIELPLGDRRGGSDIA
jgi:signal transduction histidine kinase